MRKKLYAVILLLIVAFEIVSGKEKNKTKLHKTNQKHKNVKEKSISERVKRSLNDEDDKPFWANRGKKKIESFTNNDQYYNNAENDPKVLKRNDNFEKEPFWGMRGRRESASVEDYSDNDNAEEPTYLCRNCYGSVRFDNNEKNYKDRRDESTTPFWGNRGRRSSEEIDEEWENRGRRQDNDSGWGTNGRRKDSPFWGVRGRHEDEPFWGNRGRRDNEPFWGNRGRRQNSEPFWGNRGRRQDSEPFWGTRGRRDDEPLLDYRERKKENLKDSIANAINRVENDIEHLSRLRRSSGSYWSNRGRESQLQNLFTRFDKTRLLHQPINRDFNINLKSEPGTVHDSRIFAEEPHYIVVERSSRSSAESEDPFYISRGKKYYHLVKAARGRRGAIEEIVKSVRNDPYYIARGKKDIDMSQSRLNSTSEDYLKAKELICSAVDLITSPSHNGKVKREIDSDRDRRTILKKLAAQLQIDPYYVSRGKKSDRNPDGNNLQEFITDVAGKCE